MTGTSEERIRLAAGQVLAFRQAAIDAAQVKLDGQARSLAEAVGCIAGVVAPALENCATLSRDAGLEVDVRGPKVDADGCNAVDIVIDRTGGESVLGYEVSLDGSFTRAIMMRNGLRNNNRLAVPSITDDSVTRDFVDFLEAHVTMVTRSS